MKYKNAADVLPDKLLREIQKYASGEAIYIPRAQEKRGWGMKSGARAYYQERNRRIRARHEQGAELAELAAEFGLSQESIRKILYARQEETEEN